MRLTPPPLGGLLRATLVLLLLAGCTGDDGDAGPSTAEVDPTLPADPVSPSPASPSPVSTSPGSPSPPAGTGPTTPPAPTPPAPAAPTPAPPADDPDPAAVALALEPFAELDAPTALVARPGEEGTLYVAERAGTVRPVTADGDVGDPVVDLSGDTSTGGERGLLGLAWSPAGDRLYLSSTDEEGATVLEAVDVVDDVVQGGARTQILRVPQPAANHNGGHIVFGPDGHLWLGLGDGGGADDEFGNGQRPETLLGTLLRLDVEAAGAESGDPYAIPPDNPFADGVDGAPEVWAYGLRNPWRFSFDDVTGQLWVADVGQNAVEEIDRVPADEPGLNYGWPRFEGDRPFDGQPAEGPVVDPVHTYTHSRGCSITGGVVYRGQAIPELQGAYLYTDLCNGTIHALVVDVEGAVQADVDTGLSVDSPVSFGEGPDGEVYVLSLDGPIYEIIQE